jgi:hypothetical protein
MIIRIILNLVTVHYIKPSFVHQCTRDVHLVVVTVSRNGGSTVHSVSITVHKEEIPAHFTPIQLCLTDRLHVNCTKFRCIF